jgi:hypothetical protein
MRTIAGCLDLGRVALAPGGDGLAFLGTMSRSRTALAAENLFLRKRLALFWEPQATPRRSSDGTRLARVLLTRCLAWREVLTIAQPATLIRWHRQAFRLLWCWWSRDATSLHPL